MPKKQQQRNSEGSEDEEPVLSAEEVAFLDSIAGNEPINRTSAMTFATISVAGVVIAATPLFGLSFTRDWYLLVAFVVSWFWLMAAHNDIADRNHAQQLRSPVLRAVAINSVVFFLLTIFMTDIFYPWLASGVVEIFDPIEDFTPSAFADGKDIRDIALATFRVFLGNTIPSFALYAGITRGVWFPKVGIVGKWMWNTAMSLKTKIMG